MDEVTIDEGPCSIEDVLAIADGAVVRLAPEAVHRIATSRAVVDAALASGEAVYGLNTGVGHMKDTRLPDEELRRNQEMLLASHSAGVGPPLRTELVRAAMAVRLIGIARGGSGASPGVADAFVGMLNARVHPVVAEGGSVGAADLGQLADIGLVAIGRGRAEHAGEIVSGDVALARAGIEPLRLEPKDGLTIMSSNGVSIGHAAVSVTRARRVAHRADAVMALSLEATGGNPSVALPAVAAAKPFPGQAASCRAILDALEGSERTGAGSVQDPLSFRVAPQVHGALREALTYAERAVEVELNGRGDNPLVSIEDGAMVHNGNFHPIVMAIAFDQLRVAIAHVGQISERRMSHLWDAFFELVQEAGPLTGVTGPADEAPPELLGMALRYPGAALQAELRQLAAPVTLDVPPLDIGVEDHATNAPLSVRRTEEALELLEGILAIEALLAGDVLTVRGPGPALGGGTGALLERVRATVAEGGSPAEVHVAVRRALF